MKQKKTDKKRIVSFDLDMTLLDHESWDIPESAKRALELLRRENIIVIASGRNMDHPLSTEYRDMVRPDAVIHMNGARVVAGDEVLYEHLMDKTLLRELLTYGEENGLALGVSLGDGDYFTNPQVVDAWDLKRWGECGRRFKDVWALMEMPVRTLTYVGGPEGVAKLTARFPDMKFPMFSGHMGADVVEADSSKAEGLKRLCAYYGIDRSETVAFGDSMNDYEIIKEAGIGIAMGNACEELKCAADYVTDAIDKDGVWKACRHFGLI